MGKVNVCLKRVFIILTSLFAVISALLLAYTLFNHGYHHAAGRMDDPSIITGISVLYAVGIITLLLCIIGLFGVCKEKKWPLILFTVGMTLISVILFVDLLIEMPARHKAVESINMFSEALTPLSNASSGGKTILNNAQDSLGCCGLERGYEDWGYDIPESCLCTKKPLSECVLAPKNSSLYEQSNGVSIMIYKKPCIPMLISKVTQAIDILIATSLGLMLLWMLDSALGVAILCQMGKTLEFPTVAYSTEPATSHYSVLVEAAD